MIDYDSWLTKDDPAEKDANHQYAVDWRGRGAPGGGLKEEAGPCGERVLRWGRTGSDPGALHVCTAGRRAGCRSRCRRSEMSFKQQSCSHCFTTYEFYQGTRPAIVPNCPRCGAYANGWAPMTSEEFCRSMGCTHGRQLTAAAERTQ